MITNFVGLLPQAGNPVSTPALASHLILKNEPGVLLAFEASGDATLAGAAWWLMIFDSTTVPADGAVTPKKVYAVDSGVNQVGGAFNAMGVAFQNGIVIAVSTTGPFTLTSSVHAFISGDVI